MQAYAQTLVILAICNTNIEESNCLGRRFQQHISDIRNCNGNSALAKHRDNTGHAISIKNSPISCLVKNINKRKLIEYFLIKNIW